MRVLLPMVASSCIEAVPVPKLVLPEGHESLIAVTVADGFFGAEAFRVPSSGEIVPPIVTAGEVRYVALSYARPLEAYGLEEGILEPVSEGRALPPADAIQQCAGGGGRIEEWRTAEADELPRSLEEFRIASLCPVVEPSAVAVPCPRPLPRRLGRHRERRPLNGPPREPDRDASDTVLSIVSLGEKALVATYFGCTYEVDRDRIEPIEGVAGSFALAVLGDGRVMKAGPTDEIQIMAEIGGRWVDTVTFARSLPNPDDHVVTIAPSPDGAEIFAATFFGALMRTTITATAWTELSPAPRAGPNPACDRRPYAECHDKRRLVWVGTGDVLATFERPLLFRYRNERVEQVSLEENRIVGSVLLHPEHGPLAAAVDTFGASVGEAYQLAGDDWSPKLELRSHIAYDMEAFRGDGLVYSGTAGFFAFTSPLEPCKETAVGEGEIWHLAVLDDGTILAGGRAPSSEEALIFVITATFL